ncbi:MAG: hypothetical protein M1818_007364 [Claussenomyces sp. TS43310]|nr:MAG: hypothetical protein M1818_007364 [Claussenomyces sp. TS43310]
MSTNLNSTTTSSSTTTTHPVTTQPTTSSTTTSSNPSAHNPAQSIKHAAAGIHGLGETIRGTFNSSVDEAFNPAEKSGSAAVNQSKNDAIAQQGINEVETGHFSANTKAKEGARPGNGI